MRMKPEQTNVLFRDLDLIREGLSGTNVQEDIISVSERGNAEAMEVQVRRFGKAVVQDTVRVSPRRTRQTGGTYAPL